MKMKKFSNCVAEWNAINNLRQIAMILLILSNFLMVRKIQEGFNY